MISSPRRLRRYPRIASYLAPVIATFLTSSNVALAAHGIPGVIPIAEMKGGTDASNNFKSNPNGGYLSHLNNIGEYTYPGGHGNQWGGTALPNDHATWDMPGDHFGQQHPTHSPHWDDGGQTDVWLETDEWIDYEVTAAASDTYSVTLRMASGQGPDPILPDHPDQDPPRFLIRVDVDGKEGSGPMEILWTGPDAYPVETEPSQYKGGPFGWSWIHHFFDVTSRGMPMAAGPHTLRVQMIRSTRGSTWIEYLYVDKVAGLPASDGSVGVVQDASIAIAPAPDGGSPGMTTGGATGGGGSTMTMAPLPGGDTQDASTLEPAAPADSSSAGGCACSLRRAPTNPGEGLLTAIGAFSLCAMARRRRR